VRVNEKHGFLVHSFANDDWRVCRDHVKARLGLLDATTTAPNPTFRRRNNARADTPRISLALALWGASKPLSGTLGERYFVEHRRLAIGRLRDLSHCLRYDARKLIIVALMTSAEGNKPCGVHRTFLNPDGSARAQDARQAGRGPPVARRKRDARD
jgi:putative DNA primase/helicase